MTDTDATTEAPDAGAAIDVVPESVTLDDHPADFVVSELAASLAGAASPFGPDKVFPLPTDQLWYAHPRPEDRPNLAGGL